MSIVDKIKKKKLLLKKKIELERLDLLSVLLPCIEIGWFSVEELLN